MCKLSVLLPYRALLALLFCWGCVNGPGGANTAAHETIPAKHLSITDSGAIGDDKTLNTACIQAAIDQLANKGGGTLEIPPGIFLTGAIFLKPGVNLQLDAGAVLKGSTNLLDYPRTMTRVEGHFEDWLPALINADHVDHLRITGSGTLDGNGAPFWQEFQTRFKANPKTTNLDVLRPRLAFIQNSADVVVSGIIFTNAAFWNLHFYRCDNIVVENARFEVPQGVKCPSTDGTDVDSCQHVIIRGCTYCVNDDCIALKGSKGPFALDDTNSPPVSDVRVSNCTFERGNGVVTLGSEAAVVRDVSVTNCRVSGPINLVCLKLRPDTPQIYEDIHYQDISLQSTGGMILQIRPWKQYFDLKGQPPPKSEVRNVTLSGITGSYGSFGIVEGNSNQTQIAGITLQNINVQLRNERLKIADASALEMSNVSVNGKPYLPQNSSPN